MPELGLVWPGFNSDENFCCASRHMEHPRCLDPLGMSPQAPQLTLSQWGGHPVHDSTCTCPRGLTSISGHKKNIHKIELEMMEVNAKCQQIPPTLWRARDVVVVFSLRINRARGEMRQTRRQSSWAGTVGIACALTVTFSVFPFTHTCHQHHLTQGRGLKVSWMTELWFYLFIYF